MKGLHVLTDTALQKRFSHYELGQMAAQVGASVVQYREKRYQSTLHRNELSRLAESLRDSSTVLIINDYLNLALEFGVGVHLGADDPAAEKAIAVLPQNTIIGATVHSIEEYRAIEHLNVAYIGVGPVFGTTSKQTGLPPLGFSGLEAICRISRFPVVAIGNISLENIGQLRDYGASGAAVLSAFCCADDPLIAGMALIEAFG